MEQPEQTKTAFFLYDPRYLTSRFKATLFESCDTIEEARENAPEYGSLTVIVETTFFRDANGKWDKYTEKIVS
jgi:hypothetical protein